MNEWVKRAEGHCHKNGLFHLEWFKAIMWKLLSILPRAIYTLLNKNPFKPIHGSGGSGIHIVVSQCCCSAVQTYRPPFLIVEMCGCVRLARFIYIKHQFHWPISRNAIIKRFFGTLSTAFISSPIFSLLPIFFFFRLLPSSQSCTHLAYKPSIETECCCTQKCQQWQGHCRHFARNRWVCNARTANCSTARWFSPNSTPASAKYNCLAIWLAQILFLSHGCVQRTHIQMGRPVY